MDFADATLMKTVSDGELFHAISAGSHGTAMVGFAHKYDEEQIWEFVAYLRQFAKASDLEDASEADEADDALEE